MSLIKLTGVPHPDLNDGKPQPVYVDRTRVLLICQAFIEPPKLDESRKRRSMTNKIWSGAEVLHEKVHAYIPNMTDPVALEWMQTVRAACGEVSEAYRAINRIGPEAFHPRIECTEIQLACGTALEHGVMLARVWVSESPEEVARLVNPFAQGHP